MSARNFPTSRLFAIPALLLAGLAAIASAGPAFGRNWVVLIDGSGDAPTIQAAVDSAAAAGDSILVGPGSYQEDVLIDDKTLVMFALEGRDQTVIGGVTAAIRLTDSGTKIVGFTFQGGELGADGPGTFESCAFRFCIIGADSGGGVYTSCLFNGNGTGARGGGTFVDCQFRENTDGAERGSFTDCDFSENFGSGLRIYGEFFGPITRLTNCNVSRNGRHGIEGDTFFSGGSVRVECTETTVSDNALDGLSGSGAVGFNMVDCEISGNGRNSGLSPGIALTRCVVWGNASGLRATSNGSAEGSLTVAESTYHANGGGMSAQPGAFGPPGRITVNRSIVSGTLVGRGVPQCTNPVSILSVGCSDIFGNAGGDDVCQGAGLNNFSLDPLFCDAAGGDFTLEANSPCAPANSPAGCELIGALPVGCQTLGVEVTASPQLRFGVGQNRPNPFNPSTVIDFTLPVAMPVALRIYDASGRLIRTLVEDALEAGNHIAIWNGREASGREAASGIYYYRIEGEGYGVESRKMMLVK